MSLPAMIKFRTMSFTNWVVNLISFWACRNLRTCFEGSRSQPLATSRHVSCVLIIAQQEQSEEIPTSFELGVSQAFLHQSSALQSTLSCRQSKLETAFVDATDPRGRTEDLNSG